MLCACLSTILMLDLNPVLIIILISALPSSSLCRAMYNGIGLTTPRGSGTNGYVQRNLSSLRVKRPRDERGGERDEKDRERLESQLNRQPNADILEHQRKRQLEVKCAELQDMMEEQGYARPERFFRFQVNHGESKLSVLLVIASSNCFSPTKNALTANVTKLHTVDST